MKIKERQERCKQTIIHHSELTQRNMREMRFKHPPGLQSQWELRFWKRIKRKKLPHASFTPLNEENSILLVNNKTCKIPPQWPSEAGHTIQTVEIPNHHIIQ